MRRGLTTDDLRTAAAPLDLADLGLRFDLTVPLARFYATHRAELPTVFRAVQIAPVWRAESRRRGATASSCSATSTSSASPGDGRDRAHLGDVGRARALGLVGTTIRINDRRILLALLAHWEVPTRRVDPALVIIDKLDKIGAAASRPSSPESVPTPRARGTLEELAGRLGRVAGADWLDDEAFADLRRPPRSAPRADLEFDPTLVRGMGYYTGTIFEVAHPDFGYSLGGGGRYDGMIGRFLGQDVPAAGFSLGFERLVDLVNLPETARGDAVVLLYDAPSTRSAWRRSSEASGEPPGPPRTEGQEHQEPARRAGGPGLRPVRRRAAPTPRRSRVGVRPLA